MYPSRDLAAPVRPPPLSDEEVAALQASCQSSRSALRYDPAQSLFEVAPDISGAANLLVLSDPSQSPPEIARQQSLKDQLSSQLTTSRRSASTSRNVILAPVHDDLCRDVNSSVELQTSVVDSTSVLSTPSSDVNPTSVGKSRTMVNPISGLLTTLTEQQQQYIAQATVDAMSLTSDVLARRTLSHSGDSDRSLNVPTFSESAYAQTKSRDRLLKSFVLRILLSLFSR